MSISSVGTSPTSTQDAYDRERQEAVQPKKTPEDFDFSGAAYGAVHLPTGLIASPSSPKPSLATVRADANDLEVKAKAFLQALDSPAIKEALKKNGAALATLTKIELTVGLAIAAVATLKEKGLAAVGALAIGEKVMSNGKNLLSLPDDIKTFISQFKEALPTIGYAGVDLVHAMGLGLETANAAVKLASDVKQLGGV